MSAKTEMVNFGDEIDIESLIEQGIEQARLIKTQSDEHVTKLEEENKQKGLDMQVEKIDMHAF